MKYKNLLTKGLSSTVLALVLPMFSQLSSAESITCNLDTVTLTSISLTGGAEVYNAGSNASYCVGPFMGEND